MNPLGKRMLIVVVLLGCAFGASAGESIVALRLSSPLVVTASAGYRFGDSAVEGYHPAIEFEGGVGGGRILLGLDALGNGFGFGLKAALLRTWLEPIGLDTDQTYLGLQLEAGISRFFGEIGGYRRIEGDDDNWLLSVGIGFRL